MRIAFTFHNLAQSEHLKAYAQEKLVKLQKYMRGPLEATLTFSVQRHSFCVDVSVHAGAETYQGREEQADMYWAFLHGIVSLCMNQRIKGGPERASSLVRRLTSDFIQSCTTPAMAPKTRARPVSVARRS